MESSQLSPGRIVCTPWSSPWPGAGLGLWPESHAACNSRMSALEGGGGRERRSMGLEKKFGNDRYAQCLDRGGGFIGIYICGCKNVANYILST